MNVSFWEKYAGWVLVGVSLVVGVLFVNQPYVTFTDELLFEEASWRMANGEGWLVARLDDEPWLEKAPLYFWMTGGLFKVLEATPLPLMDLDQSLDENMIYVYPFVRRVVTVVASSVVCFMTYLIAKELWDWRYGVAAGVILLASPLYLFTPLSASLDMTATAWMAVCVWGYLKYVRHSDEATTSEESSANTKGKKDPSQMLRVDQDDATTNSWKWMRVMGVSLAGAVMTRSVLGLTPLAVIIVDQLLRIVKRYRTSRQSGGQVDSEDFAQVGKLASDKYGVMKLGEVVLGMGIFLVLVVPWHGYMWGQFGMAWLGTYLGYNIVERTTGVIDGYADRSWWYFLWRLVVMTPGWVLSLAVLAGWSLDRLKSNEMIRLGSLDKLEMTGVLRPDNARIIVLWLVIPLIVFSMSATRLDWYAVQLLPSLAILGSAVAVWLWQLYAGQQLGGMRKHLMEIFGLAILLTPGLTLLFYQGTQASPVAALADLRSVTAADETVYSYKRAYFPSRLLYRPRPIVIVTTEGLQVLGREKTDYLFVTSIEYAEVEAARPDAVVWEQYNGGRIYVFDTGNQGVQGME